ncbi:hypothetical protein ONR75_03390 [Rhodopseudomonas sp. P2A-2r]|uniref:hypothetical protein n=1 Tax=Rhodopseudomonas sp. P2A-2r TaxID=2991972 RepID=UPI002234D06C|nr:hypothetical protein [Rhodopseudomonas sp. P2A-2r]UZE49852.1 hypothetical protein ONR75_03390 [Rhodopseudomonas sp. P2A-2r]
MKKTEEVFLAELRREMPSPEIWVIKPESILVMVVATPLEEEARKPNEPVRGEPVLDEMRQMETGRLEDAGLANVVARRAPELVLNLSSIKARERAGVLQMPLCRRALASIILGLAITGLIGSAAVFAAELGCAHYAAFKKLPNGFREIASGSLVGGAEIFVLSNGSCTCDNGPALSRHFGRPTPQGEHWSCRDASGDELEVR